MRHLLPTLALALAVLSLPAIAQKPEPAPPTSDAVYKAFGEKAGIQAVVDDFVGRLLVDPRIGVYFKDTNRARLVELLTDQFCVETGGPCEYDGAPMDLSHADLDIGKAEFNALVEVLQQSMNAKGVPFRAQNGLLARLAPMHRDIITRR